MSETHSALASKTPRPSLTYKLVSSLLVFPIFRGLFRGSCSGHEHVPRQGPLVVVANHGSHLDPPLLPVAILNSHRALGSGHSLPRLVPIQLRIGEPVPAPSGRRRADLDATTAELQRRINSLLDQGLLRP